MLHRSYGGVRPAERKGPTKREAAIPMDPPPRRVFLPVGQDAGETLLVQPGDQVCVGQPLSSGGARGSSAHASVSGTVTAIEPRPQSDGGERLCVVIENDGKETALERPTWLAAPRRDAPYDLTPGEIAETARLAGLAGEGGAPTDLTIQKAMGHTELLIINALEWESYVTADRRLMLERPKEVVGGAKLLMRALGAPRGIIAVSGSAYDAASALRNLLPLRGGELRVKVLRTRYPQGQAEQLVQRLTGRRIPQGGESIDVGCAIFSVVEAAALYDGVYDAKPFTHRIVTVGGGAVARPGNLLVPIGTALSDVVAAAGGWQCAPDRVVVGGPMAGWAQSGLEAPVTKDTGAVLGLTKGEERGAGKRENACIRCGRCLEVCPMRLQPNLLRLYTDAGEAETLSGLHIEDCTECGACAWACPARLRLVENIRQGKALLRQAGEAGTPSAPQEELAPSEGFEADPLRETGPVQEADPAQETAPLRGADGEAAFWQRLEGTISAEEAQANEGGEPGEGAEV